MATKLVNRNPISRASALASTASQHRFLRAFSAPAFRWFFLSMCSWFAAMTMLQLVNGVLVFDLTGSYSALGLVALAQAIPMLVFSMPGGVLADRYDKDKIIQAGQVINAGIALTIAVITLSGNLAFHHLIISSVAQGAVFALLLPARQTMIPELVAADGLMNGVSLNAAGQNTMRLAAPAIGGVLVAIFGAGLAYTVITVLLAASAILMIPVRANIDTKIKDVSTTSKSAQSGLSELIEGCQYIWREKPVRLILLTNSVIVFLAMPMQQILPGFVADVLDAGPSGLGVIMSLLGLGTLIGSIGVIAMAEKNRGVLLVVSGLILGASLVAFSLSSVFWVSAILVTVLGIGQAGRVSMSNVLLQVYSDPAYRGRVMSVYMTQFSMVSFGTFAVGILANSIGPQAALAATGVGLLVFSILCLLTMRSIRAIQ